METPMIQYVHQGVLSNPLIQLGHALMKTDADDYNLQSMGMLSFGLSTFYKHK